MKKEEHFEVILEDINSKLDLVFENFQSLNHKIDQNKIDSDNRNDETNKLLKFAYDDLDKKIQGNGSKIEQNSNLIKENRTLIKENSKKIENNGSKIEENKKLIKEN
jgi:predicted  nucleic acid-binding Zn-ribbon protein